MRTCLLPKLVSCQAPRIVLAHEYIPSITIVANKEIITGDEMEPWENLAMAGSISQEVPTVEL